MSLSSKDVEDRHGWLEPCPQPDEGLHTIRVSSIRPSNVGGLAQLSFVFDPDIGREFAQDLVSQAEPRLDRGNPGADFALRNVLRRKTRLDARLQDQALGNLLIVFGLDPRGQIAAVRQEQRPGNEKTSRRSLSERVKPWA